jgi:hypothetical protein
MSDGKRPSLGVLRHRRDEANLCSWNAALTRPRKAFLRIHRRHHVPWFGENWSAERELSGDVRADQGGHQPMAHAHCTALFSRVADRRDPPPQHRGLRLLLRKKLVATPSLALTAENPAQDGEGDPLAGLRCASTRRSPTA